MVERLFEVAVIGAGPGGASAAIRLADLGRRVLLVDKDDSPRLKVGESLAPKAGPLLAQLGILDQVDSSHLPYFGNRSFWGGATPVFFDFLRERYGQGWHLDRVRFETTLRRAALERGICFRRGRLRKIGATANGYRITITDGNAESDFEALWVVDATGRSSAVSSKLGFRREVLDRITASAVFCDSEQEDDGDCFSTIEAQHDGWWYSAQIPKRRVVVFHGAPEDAVDERSFRRRLEETSCIKTLLTAAQRERLTPFRMPANSSRLRNPVGKRWIAVGDSCAAFDPVSSYGIVHALQTGIRGGEAVNDALRADPEKIERYAQDELCIFDLYLRRRASCYKSETRWTESRFWQKQVWRG